MAVAGREEDAVAVEDDGLRHVGHNRRRPGVLPQQGALRGVQSDRPRRGDGDDLPAPGDGRQHRRRVCLDVVERMPGDLAAGAVVGRHRPAVRAAGLHHDQVVHDQRRTGHRPLQVVGAGVLEDVAAPQQLAGAGVQRAQLAGGAQRIQPSRVPGRRGARPRSAHRLLEMGVPGVGPQLAPGFCVVGRDHFLVAPLLDGERAPLRDDERRVAAADRLRPERVESLRGPVGAHGGLGVMPVAARAPEVGPVDVSRRSGGVVGRCRCGGRAGGQQPRVVLRAVQLQRLVVFLRVAERHDGPQPAAGQLDPHVEHPVQDSGRRGGRRDDNRERDCNGTQPAQEFHGLQRSDTFTLARPRMRLVYH